MIIDFTNINGGGGGGYVLPVASQSTLGGVKVGQNLTIDSGGTLNAVGGEQDYKIVTGITDYSAGKMYGIVTNGGTYEFTGNPSTKINCGNVKTHFYGEVADTSARYEFNPWISAPVNGSNQIVDVYVTKETSDSYPTLTVKYVNDNALTETLTHNLEDTGKDTYALSAHTFNGFVFSGVNISVIFNGDNSIVVDFDGESGTTLGEMKIDTAVFNWNTNVDNCSGSTISDEQRFNGISYTNGTTALPLTFIEGNSMVQIVSGSDDMHKRLRPLHLGESSGIGSANGYTGDICFWDNRLWVLRNYNDAVNCSVYNENIENSSDTEHVIQWYGDLPTGQILFVLTAVSWGSELWYIDFDSNSDQFRLYKNVEEEIINIPRIGAAVVLYGTINWSAKDGLITIYGNGINWEIGVYGNWNQVSGNHWEPLDWLPNTTNPRKFIVDYSILPNATSDRKGAVVVSTPSVNTEANYNQGIGCSETTNGFITDIKYINEAYTGTIGSRGIHNGDNSFDAGFTIYFNDNGELEWNVIDWNTYTYLASGAVQSGTSTVAQGEDYEATITLSGTTVEMAYTNPNIGTSVWLNNFEMPNIPILCYQANGTTYYVKQR